MDITSGKTFKYRHFAVIAVIILLTVVSYSHLWSNQFINFDDDIYIFENPFIRQGITWESFHWAFTFSNDVSFWHPLTWLSLMVDYELFGLSPRGFHLVNLMLHICNAILLFHLLNLMTARFWQSTWVALLFAVHPVNVESVAWAAERKNVLSVLFFFLTIWAYRNYVQLPVLKKYLLVLLTMALGLMAKPLLVSLPFLLLLLDYWPLSRLPAPDGKQSGPGNATFSVFGRCSLFTLAMEKVPLLALSLLSVLVSILSNGSLMQAATATMADKIENALVSYIAYMGKMLWPTGLAFYYPLQSFPLWKVTSAAVLLIILSLAAVRFFYKRPWLAVGWFWYLGVFFPLIGLVRGGLWPAMADRYAYLPYIGLFMILAWEGCELAKRMRNNRVLVMVAGGIIVSLIICTNKQVFLWRDSISLFTHATKVTGNNNIAFANLGTSYMATGNLAEGIKCLKEAIRINPSLEAAHFNLGNAYLRLGALDEAYSSYSRALTLNPKVDKIHLQLAVVLDKMNRQEEALQHLATACEINPRNAEALWLMGNILAQQKNYGRAIITFRQLTRMKPDDLKAIVNLGSLLAMSGKYEDSAVYFQKALLIDPQNQIARQSLEALKAKGYK